MIKFIQLFVIIMIYLIDNTMADIIKTNNFEVIRKATEKADSTTLVVFDIDDVLFTLNGDYNFHNPVRKELARKLKEKYPLDKYDDYMSLIYANHVVQLVHPEILNVLKNLRERNIPTVALTAWGTGPYGTAKKLEELRFISLDQTGISFIETSPFKEDTIFPELKTKGRIPMIIKGVILSAATDKGPVLKAALKKAKLNFKKIIFIDDLLVNTESVKKMSEELNIEFKGIQYTAASLIEWPALDAEREQLRFEIFEKEFLWLLDPELDKRIKK